MTNLFKTEDGNWISDVQIRESLMDMGAHDCDVLYIHSALNFGLPNMEIKNGQLLKCLLDTIELLNVPTVVMPTFTFSFCNGKSYDPLTSKSRMGALNEFFRKQDGVIRSNDPLMSVALKGKDTYLATNVGTHSISDGSTFDMIHHKSGVKFLFIGPRIGDCLTYMHYLEWLFDVDYRYIRHFIGEIIDNGTSKTIDQDLFVRYNGVFANDASYKYEDWMVEEKAAKRIKLGNGFLSIVGEKDATNYYKKCLEIDPHYFIEIKNNIKDKTFKLNNEMVAL
ncbi:AAC(3) family N-acetyltransferase [uncultured Muribaculum sp.]|uniref:AAC(3) family N-acetyltransferase n=2 Tax=uncultured Muribaculum sp. TaxID=1918613 RepID=UPI000F47EFDD|nr:AAC(3) family N-acetyltransferase [uncultured Muribaculum sp.]ROT12200.1 hypothetical protein EEL48_13270 [Muribaculaceae bacterium Isolate-102 (HZI)]